MYVNPYIIQISPLVSGIQMASSRSNSHRSKEKIHVGEGPFLLIRKGLGDPAKMHS